MSMLQSYSSRASDLPESAQTWRPYRQAKTARAESTSVEAVVGEPPTDLRPSTAYWRGASGRLYRLSAHTLIYCPQPGRGIYILARRDARGRLAPLGVGLSIAAASLNLAHIRKRGARLGATEVHLCPMPNLDSTLALRRVVRDLGSMFAADR